jgi:major membrane immunogen (membrane-anchored lipoprotein)
MKKFVIVMLAAVMLLVVCGACNMQVVDTTWSYEKGIITLPNGDVVEGKVETWREYSDSDMLQVKIDGKQYLTHSVNVVLISE